MNRPVRTRMPWWCGEGARKRAGFPDFSRLSLLFLDSKLEGNNRIHSVSFQRFFSLRGSSPCGNDAPGPRLACPTGSRDLMMSARGSINGLSGSYHPWVSGDHTDSSNPTASASVHRYQTGTCKTPVFWAVPSASISGPGFKPLMVNNPTRLKTGDSPQHFFRHPFGGVLGPILCELGALARNPLLAFPRRAGDPWVSRKGAKLAKGDSTTKDIPRVLSSDGLMIGE